MYYTTIKLENDFFFVTCSCMKNANINLKKKNPTYFTRKTSNDSI